VNSSRLVLAGLAALLILGLWYAQLPPTTRPISRPKGDIVLFQAVVERMRAGQPYYAAMNTELRQRAYPTASVVNWRLPGTFLLVAHAPRAAHFVALTLGVIGLAGSVLLFRNAAPLLTIAAAIIQLGAAVLPAIPVDGLYMPEMWAAILLLLSVLASAFGLVRLAVCCAIGALCARELILPYVLISLGLALRGGRTLEVRWYLAGLALFVTYYAAHAVMAHRYIVPGDYGYTTWLIFNGWRFVVSTVGMGGWYLVLPTWTAAVGAVIIVASLWSPADIHLKIIVAMYVVTFCVVGHYFNSYWGLMTGPSWGLATVYGLVGLRRLAGEA
jgi:hypothetical protein